jgi:hypothetical protein
MHPNEALFANEAFYLAFNQKDPAAMRQVWSESAELLCLHPGWPALIGREAVLSSWDNILTNQNQVRVQMYQPQAVTVANTDGHAVMVICYEQVGSTVMVATNLFVTEDSLPKLMAHQSGPCGDPPPAPTEDLGPLANNNPSH